MDRSSTIGRAAFENQITGKPAFALGLGLIPGAGEARPRSAPIVRTLGGPLEFACAHQVRQRPGAIVGPVGYEPKRSTRLERPRDGGDRCVLDEAALPVPAFRPRIRMDEIETRDR